VSGNEDDTGHYDIGSFSPSVPFLSPRDAVDRGPAGSLIQARDRERAQRRAGLPPAVRDWHVWVGCAAAGVAVAQIAFAIPLFSEKNVAGPLLVLSGMAAAMIAAIVVWGRYLPGGVEADLSRQITRERAAARELDTLQSLGWTVLHDRLVPGTEHRVAHVLAGPAGLIVATVLPLTGPLHMRSKVLMSGDVPLDSWFATRWWEVNTIEAEMGRRLTAWTWTGPTYPVVLFPGDESAGFRLPLPNKTPAWFPPAHARTTIRATGRVREWATALPAPLGRLAAAQLAGALEAACVPAGTREQQR
jgi:hypothetical protein